MSCSSLCSAALSDPPSWLRWGLRAAPAGAVPPGHALRSRRTAGASIPALQTCSRLPLKRCHRQHFVLPCTAGLNPVCSLSAQGRAVPEQHRSGVQPRTAGGPAKTCQVGCSVGLLCATSLASACSLQAAAALCLSSTAAPSSPALQEHSCGSRSHTSGRLQEVVVCSLS